MQQVTDGDVPRHVSSYRARWPFKDKVQFPPNVTGVEDTIDIHTHAHRGQQDPLSLAVFASISGMGGLLYKSIDGDPKDPMASVRALEEQLHRVCDEEKIRPIQCWGGFFLGFLGIMHDAAEVRRQAEKGVAAVWMPVNGHANTLTKAGAQPYWWDKTADPNLVIPPMTLDEARAVGGLYLLDDRGQLLDEIKEVFKVVADQDVAVFFGHATHPEMDAMAEEVYKLGITKAVVDHPFSPFVDLNLEQMKRYTSASITMNFTYDELSPMLGINPKIMADTIKELDLNYVTLSSDCGEPLLPNSVEGMRQIIAYMKAFGLTDEEVRRISVDNPARIVKYKK